MSRPGPRSPEETMMFKWYRHLRRYDYAQLWFTCRQCWIDHGFTMEEILGPCRRRDMVLCRRAIAKHLRSNGATLMEIAACLCRDHSTIHTLLSYEYDKVLVPVEPPTDPVDESPVEPPKRVEDHRHKKPLRLVDRGKLLSEGKMVPRPALPEATFKPGDGQRRREEWLARLNRVESLTSQEAPE